MSRSRAQPRFELPLGLVMRPWLQGDTAGLVLAMHDPLVRHYAGFLVEDRTQALARVQRSAAAWADRSGANWVISTVGGEVVGAVGFGQILNGVESGSVGYWLLPSARGGGVVSTAVRAGTRAVFEHLDWHRIELYHAVENERSCAVARRCGYAYEGVMREAMRYPDDGRWSDEHLHARLITDRVT
ncbi:MAG TPA: GNAT family N-acetyltransferase [Kineosporiaceae bacterium]|nr:GNAT family N-acetyltransferase [Kineosporiaceae bacterium]